MNKKLPLISLFIMSIISILYWAFKPEELYEAKWNAPDNTLAITIDGEVSTTFPTKKNYTTDITCTSGTGNIEWNGTKWILTTSGITKGSTKCNVIFKLQTFGETILANNEVKTPITTPGASDYASTHGNINKSTILKNLETWYTNSLAPYEDKLADTIWCNDKSTVSGGLGYGTNETNYAAYNRIYSTKEPTLKCPNDNNGGKLSKFTVDDTANGNGNLTYKIGLITADELAFAGYAYGFRNTTTYLQENATLDKWWSLSPYGFNGSYAYVLSVSGTRLGGTNFLGIRADAVNGVRPSISLVSSTTISGGSGTSEDPYVVN